MDAITPEADTAGTTAPGPDPAQTHGTTALVPAAAPAHHSEDVSNPATGHIKAALPPGTIALEAIEAAPHCESIGQLKYSGEQQAVPWQHGWSTLNDRL